METLEFALFILLNLNLESRVGGKVRRRTTDRKSIQRSKDEKRL